MATTNPGFKTLNVHYSSLLFEQQSHPPYQTSLYMSCFKLCHISIAEPTGAAGRRACANCIERFTELITEKVVALTSTEVGTA